MSELLKKLKYKRDLKKSDKKFVNFRKREEELVSEWGFYDKNRKFQDNAVKADSIMTHIKSIRNSMKNNAIIKRQLKEKYEGVPLGTYKK